MKKHFIYLLLVPMLAFNTSTKEIDIVGKWSGEDNGETGTFIFYEDSFVALIIKGKKIGGKSFEFDGETLKMTYAIDFAKDPVEMDIIMSDMEDNVKKTIYFIAEFENENTMKLASNGGDAPRPKTFNEGKTISLSRVEE